MNERATLTARRTAAVRNEKRSPRTENGRFAGSIWVFKLQLGIKRKPEVPRDECISNRGGGKTEIFNLEEHWEQNINVSERVKSKRNLSSTISQFYYILRYYLRKQRVSFLQ